MSAQPVEPAGPRQGPRSTSVSALTSTHPAPVVICGGSANGKRALIAALCRQLASEEMPVNLVTVNEVDAELEVDVTLSPFEMASDAAFFEAASELLTDSDGRRGTYVLDGYAHIAEPYKDPLSSQVRFLEDLERFAHESGGRLVVASHRVPPVWLRTAARTFVVMGFPNPAEWTLLGGSALPAGLGPMQGTVSCPDGIFTLDLDHDPAGGS